MSLSFKRLKTSHPAVIGHNRNNHMFSCASFPKTCNSFALSFRLHIGTIRINQHS